MVETARHAYDPLMKTVGAVHEKMLQHKSAEEQKKAKEIEGTVKDALVTKKELIA